MTIYINGVKRFGASHLQAMHQASPVEVGPCLFLNIGTCIYLPTIGNKAAVPRIEYPPLQVVRMNEANLHNGVQEMTVDGVTVRATSPARTVAD